MIEQIVFFILYALSFTLGYIFGSKKQDVIYQQTIKKVKDLIHPTELGAIERPDAQKLASWEDTPENETKQAMKETLDQLQQEGKL